MSGKGKENSVMKRMKRTLSALLTGAVLLSMCASSGCAVMNQEKTLSEEEILALASEKAGQVGIAKDDLHGQYSFFLEYMDRVATNEKLGDFREFVIRLFPEVAAHIRDENKALFLDKISKLQFEIGDIEFGGEYHSDTEKVIVSSNYYQWEEGATCFILYHETFHFVDRYIDGMEQVVTYNGMDFFPLDNEVMYEGSDEYVRCSFADEGMADLYVAKSLSKTFDSYRPACNFLTTMEYIYGSDVVEDMLFDRNTTMKFISILKELDYENSKILKIIKDFNAYTYDFWDADPVTRSFEDVLVDMYQKKIGPDWQNDPQFCFLLYNQTRAYSPSRRFSGNYLHSEITNVTEKELANMQTRCDTINQTADIFCEEDDPETWHTVFYVDGELWLSEPTWTYDENDDYEIEIQLLRYDFEKETIVEHTVVTEMEFPDKLHEDYLAKTKD